MCMYLFVRVESHVFVSVDSDSGQAYREQQLFCVGESDFGNHVTINQRFPSR